MTVRVAIITAAGSGSRLGFGIPKALVSVEGVPMVLTAAQKFAACSHIIITAPESHLDAFADVFRSSAAGPLGQRVQVVAGGQTRAESVNKGLALAPLNADVILIHDAARPYVSEDLIERVCAAVTAGAKAVVPVQPVTDSLKRVQANTVVDHVDRAEFARAQTPQGFNAQALRTAYAHAEASGLLSTATDDVTVVAAAGVPVITVPGEEANIKLTFASDLSASRNQQTQRAGFATDAHAFARDGELALAGLKWPGEPALVGHSDGDAAIHALCDALLSAAGLGDLGAHFGTAEPQWKDAESIRLLHRTIELLAEAGWQPVSAQIQIIGNRPRFAARRDEAQDLLTSVVGIPVFISATTTDGLGFTGRGEGIAATAMVLVEKGTAR
jgi:2-C-methyl-D-erythritol 4-phosphate cytidylyltransferase/2-C-methyl-D-erythritol 2,4-cyclodiphosphate synthase